VQRVLSLHPCIVARQTSSSSAFTVAIVGIEWISEQTNAVARFHASAIIIWPTPANRLTAFGESRRWAPIAFIINVIRCSWATHECASTRAVNVNDRVQRRDSLLCYLVVSVAQSDESIDRISRLPRSITNPARLKRKKKLPALIQISHFAFRARTHERRIPRLRARILREFEDNGTRNVNIFELYFGHEIPICYRTRMFAWNTFHYAGIKASRYRASRSFFLICRLLFRTIARPSETYFFLFRPKNYYKLSLRITFSNTFDNL